MSARAAIVALAPLLSGGCAALTTMHVAPGPFADRRPMPAAKALTDEQVWDLVNYVQSMPFESLSDPRQHEPGNTRERM